MITPSTQASEIASADAGLRQRSPILWSKVQSVLGHDLVEKIRRTHAG